ncbi:MAG: hypothetical protein BJ554DRAFT_5653 [Olpidium bornovanus]|uniref:Uncharacterized protein n=1 Tax=Olpidium bornovanus TaxID=278681 RepID=A0A8H7ZZ94_9FUNG|nr:MAG: hypothetical protein BJ554DRAFT_5653 [Olpidium bornovanus]
MEADVVAYQVASGRSAATTTLRAETVCGYLRFWLSNRKPHAALIEILETIRRMPYRVQQVCNIQFFAWFGWFPHDVGDRSHGPWRTHGAFGRFFREGHSGRVLLPAAFRDCRSGLVHPAAAGVPEVRGSRRPAFARWW